MATTRKTTSTRKTTRRVKAAAATPNKRVGKFIILGEDFDQCYCSDVFDNYEAAVKDAERHCREENGPMYVAELLSCFKLEGVVQDNNMNHVTTVSGE